MAHEAQPHKSDQHQLVEKESRDHSTPPPAYRWGNEGILLGFQTVGISRKLEVHGRVEDPRFTSVRDCGKAWQVIEERLTAWFTARPVKEAIDTFSRHGIPINAVNDIPTAAHESQLHDRELLVEVPDPIAERGGSR